jgi:predicted alpha/beta hydrolase family esterase
MKKVFLIHGFGASPNSGWLPWLMGALEQADVYACALPMPFPSRPLCPQWVEEIARVAERSAADDIYLVGHSLGVPAILRYLQQAPWSVRVKGAVLVSGPAEDVGEERIRNFLDRPFDFATIQTRASRFTVIHGDDDPVVPFDHARFLSERLGAELVPVPGGSHLRGGDGYYQLPEALEALIGMFREE